MPVGAHPRVSGPAWVVLVVGLVITGVLALLASVAHSDNEDRLLQQRTKEASAVLSAAVPPIEAPLAEVARLAASVGADDPDLVRRTMQQFVDSGRFSAMAVRGPDFEEGFLEIGEPRDDGSRAPVATDGEAAEAQIEVVDLLEGPRPGIGYRYALPESPRTIVFAELDTPADRRSQVEPDNAFVGLEHALYLGVREDPDQLIFATTMDLPLRGRRAVEQVEIGDTVLSLVMTPAGTLGGTLSVLLPWMVLAVGTASAGTGSVMVEILQRRRRNAEQLSDEVEQLFARERDIAHTLQQSLLPTGLPTIRGVEIAARYVAGAAGTEVGGDWYDVIDLGNGRLSVIVGDVAGRGVQAAAIMAGMRYSAHALAAQGMAPHEVLQRVNALEDIRGDFVTVLCGTIDVGARTVELARAGHPSPLLVHGSEAAFLTGTIGPPVGFLDGTRYESDLAPLPSGSTLLLFTDGLYERRGEAVDVGLKRLRSVAATFDGSVDALLEHVYDELVGAQSRDDVAMLAIRLAP